MLLLIPWATIGNADCCNAESVWIVFKNHCHYGNQKKKILILYYKESVKGFLFTSDWFPHALFISYKTTFLK